MPKVAKPKPEFLRKALEGLRAHRVKWPAIAEKNDVRPQTQCHKSIQVRSQTFGGPWARQ